MAPHGCQRKTKFPSIYQTIYLPKWKFWITDYGYPHSNALLQYPLKLEPWKLYKPAHHSTKCEVIIDVKLFATVYHRIDCIKFWCYSIRFYKSKCIIISVLQYIWCIGFIWALMQEKFAGRNYVNPSLQPQPQPPGTYQPARLCSLISAFFYLLTGKYHI